jgi:septum site-determining protein MinC
MEAFSSSDGTMAESATSAFTRSRAAFDLKGVMASLTVLRLRSRDLNLIERQLRAKVMQFPQFFQSAPVVLDLSELEGGVEGFPLAALVKAMQVSRVVPVGVTNLPEAHRSIAASAGLGVVALSNARPPSEPEPAPQAQSAQAPHVGAEPSVAQKREITKELPAIEAWRSDRRPRHDQLGDDEPTQRTPMPQPPAAVAASKAAPPPPPPPARAAAAAPSAHRTPMVIRQPVRSGQLVYAERNDLIVLAPVNPGAQLIADGNIHIYAPLRGRAVAGAKGFTEARIFCQRLEAELVAISGTYVTSEDIPREMLRKPVQVSLQNGQCVITAL